MAITLEKKKEENGGDLFEVVLNNGHVTSLENIVKKYDSIENVAQALDFIIKSVGNDDRVAENITVNDTQYMPAKYSN